MISMSQRQSQSRDSYASDASQPLYFPSSDDEPEQVSRVPKLDSDDSHDAYLAKSVREQIDEVISGPDCKCIRWTDNTMSL